MSQSATSDQSIVTLGFYHLTVVERIRNTNSLTFAGYSINFNVFFQALMFIDFTVKRGLPPAVLNVVAGNLVPHLPIQVNRMLYGYSRTMSVIIITYGWNTVTFTLTVGFFGRVDITA
ncbi:hypothetical protein BC628DRAFT_1421644 [Trametes gibbosa]|nr:hypothetical protein BC628DRAFT_1421644 [Trametes gibbosa]